MVKDCTQLTSITSAMFDFHSTTEGLRIDIDVASFDASNVDQFKTDFEKVCPDELGSVDVDLAKVEMIDSSAIGALLSVHRKLNGHGPISIHNPRPSVLSVIELLRLHRVFNIEVDNQAA